MSSERIEYFDFLRGIAIIFVIAIHSFSPFSLNESNTVVYHLAILWRQIIGCAVPIFMAISGYFMSYKVIDTQSKYHAFIKKQIPRVYVPMLVWSLPFLINSYLNDVSFIKSLIWFLVGGFSVYYFIFLIVQYYILLPKLQSLMLSIGGGKMLICSGLVSFGSMIVLFILTNVLNFSIPLVAYAGFFPVWIVFFVLGLYLGKNKIQLSTRMMIIFTFLGLLISVAETYFNIWYTGRFTGLGIKTGAFIYSFFAILLLFSFNKYYTSNSIMWKLLTYIGKVSFGIYLIHMYLLSFIVRPAVVQLNIEDYFLNQMMLVILTTMSCVIIIYFSRKVSLKHVSKYLGF